MNVLEQQKDAELEAYELKLIALQEKLTGLATITADNFEEAAIHIGACKAAERWIESERDKKVRPLNDEVKEINTRYKGCASKWESVRTRLERGCSLFRMEQKRLADEKQRLELEAARREQAEKEEKLRIEREALAKKEEEERIAREHAELQESNIDLKIARAERELSELQESMPENLSVAQQRQLRTKEERVLSLRAEKVALEPVVIDASAADAKREEIARLEAEVSVPVVAQVVEQVASTVKTGAGSVSFKDDKKNWALPGWNKTSKLYADSALLAGIDAKWLLRFCIVDAVRLNAAYKSGEMFPKPFGEVVEFGGSMVRKG